MMHFKNSHSNFFLECLTCGVSSLTLSYLSLKVIAPLDKIVFYVSLYIHSRLTSFSDIEAFSPSLVSSTCFFLVRDFCTLSLLFVTWEFIFFAWSFHFDPNLASFLEKFSNVLLQYRSFILVSFKFFSSVWSFAKRAVNIDVKIKSDEAENIATFLCWLRDDVHIHLATLIGQQSRALLT